MKTEIGFRSGNKIVLDVGPADVRKFLVDSLNEDKSVSRVWFARDTLLLNVNEIEYVKEVNDGQG
jgi:hypothetical protein